MWAAPIVCFPHQSQDKVPYLARHFIFVSIPSSLRHIFCKIILYVYCLNHAKLEVMQGTSILVSFSGILQ